MKLASIFRTIYADELPFYTSMFKCCLKSMLVWGGFYRKRTLIEICVVSSTAVLECSRRHISEIVNKKKEFAISPPKWRFIWYNLWYRIHIVMDKTSSLIKDITYPLQTQSLIHNDWLNKWIECCNYSKR